MTRSRDIASNGGLVLINTTTFSGASSVNVNNCFSSTYKNYKVLFNLVSSDDAAVRIRFRVNGADDTTTNYHYHMQYGSSASTSYAAAVGQSLNYLSFTTSYGVNSTKNVDMTIFNPYVNDWLKLNWLHTLSAANSNAQFAGGAGMGAFSATTSFDGFSIVLSSGTITGSLKVYGIKD